MTPALAFVAFSDLLIAISPDGECHRMTIRNTLGAALTAETHVILGDIEVTMRVMHRSDNGPETITLHPPVGWIADPAQLVLPDHDTADVLFCPAAMA